MFAYESSLESFHRGGLKPNRIKIFQPKNPNAQTRRPFVVDLRKSARTRRSQTASRSSAISTKPTSARVDTSVSRRSAHSVKFEDTHSVFGSVSRPDTILGSYRDFPTDDETDTETKELNVGEVFETIDHELEWSRSRSRTELIDNMSRNCLNTLNRLSMSHHHMNKQISSRLQSNTTRSSSRRSSSSTNPGRPSSAMEIIRNRAQESISLQLIPTTPNARPSSVASMFSNEDNNSDYDPSGKTEKSGNIFGLNSASMYQHVLSSGGGRRGKGAFESVKPCKRMESILNEDLAAVVNDLSRQCCDVLGPNLCTECIKNVKQFNNFIAYHQKHPDIDETAMTLYAIPLIQRMFPELQRWQIKAKLASG